MMNLGSVDSADTNGIKSSPVCSSKRKLIDAKAQDESYQRIVVTADVTRDISERMVNSTLQTAVNSILSSHAEKQVAKHDNSDNK